MFPGMEMEKMREAAERAEAEERRLAGMSSFDAAQQLRNAWVLLNDGDDFKPGEIVKPKRGLEDTYTDPPGRRLLFVEYLEPGDPRFHERSDALMSGRSGIRQDCVVGRIMNGGAIGLVLSDSRFLERVGKSAADNVVPIT